MIPDPIQAELLDLKERVDEQIKVVEVQAAERGFQAAEMMNTDGTFTMVPLLNMKIQILTSLAALRSTVKISGYNDHHTIRENM